MKLMSFQQTQDLKAQEISREVLRTQDIKETAQEMRRKLADAEADFKNTLANHRDIWVKEKLVHAQRLTEMDTEVRDLETRKAQALIPIQMYEDEAKQKITEAKGLLAITKQKEEGLDDLRERLEIRLDEVGEREESVKKEESKLQSAKLGIEQQSETIKSRAQDLSEAMQGFMVSKQQEEKKLRDRETDIILKERTNLAKEGSLRLKEKSLDEWDIRLKDERGILDRIYTRAGISPLNSTEK